MRIGYARVSEDDQNLALQLDALNHAGCELIFKEKISGKLRERPELDKMLAMLRKGDQVVVWKLDRLGRSTQHLVKLGEDFRRDGIDLVITTMNVDTSTPMGRMFYVIMAGFAELEREQISERTKAGLASARARGRVGGRPRLDPAQISKKAYRVKSLLDAGDSPVDIQRALNISRATYYRLLRQAA